MMMVMAYCTGLEVNKDHIEAAWIWLRFTGGKIAGLDTLELKAVF